MYVVLWEFTLQKNCCKKQHQDHVLWFPTIHKIVAVDSIHRAGKEQRCGLSLWVCLLHCHTSHSGQKVHFVWVWMAEVDLWWMAYDYSRLSRNEQHTNLGIKYEKKWWYFRVFCKLLCNCFFSLCGSFHASLSSF